MYKLCYVLRTHYVSRTSCGRLPAFDWHWVLWNNYFLLGFVFSGERCWCFCVHWLTGDILFSVLEARFGLVVHSGFWRQLSLGPCTKVLWCYKLWYYEDAVFWSGLIILDSYNTSCKQSHTKLFAYKYNTKMGLKHLCPPLHLYTKSCLTGTNWVCSR